MGESLRRTLLACCLVGFWLSLLACWVAAPLLFYPHTVLDPEACAGLEVSASFGIANGMLPLLLAMTAVYALPVAFLFGMSRTSERNKSADYPKAAVILFALSLGITWMETYGDALACGASGGFPFWGLMRTILLLVSLVVTPMLFVEAISMARHYVVEPD
jgi:hypothetical protein